MPGQYLGNPNGGMVIYYIQPPTGKVTAFKKVCRDLSTYLSLGFPNITGSGLPHDRRGRNDPHF